MSEWDLNSGLNVAAWSICAADAQHPLLCYCLFVYGFLQLLNLVSQRLIILSGASQNWSFLFPCLLLISFSVETQLSLLKQLSSCTFQFLCSDLKCLKWPDILTKILTVESGD